MNLSNATIYSLLSSLPVATPAPTRYFLVAFVHQFGLVEWADLKLKELAERLGVSDRVASAAIRDLSDAGLLEAVRRGGGRGRKGCRYCLSRRAIRLLLAMAGAVNTGHEELIGVLLECPSPGGVDLLSGAIEKKARRGPPNPDSLNITSKLILTVLLAEADPCGVVRSRSSTWIAKITGVSVQRARRHLRKLWRLGFLRNVISGMAGKAGIGKSSSTYFLNLAHPVFKGIWSGRSFILEIDKKKWLDERQQGPELPQMIKALGAGHDDEQFVVLEYGERAAGVRVRCESVVAEELRDALKGIVTTFVQGVLDDCAAQILTSFRHRIGVGPIPVPSYRLESALTGPLRRKGGEREHSPASEFLSGWVFWTAWEKAELLRLWLGRVAQMIPVDSVFALMPSSEYEERIVLKLIFAPLPGKKTELANYQSKMRSGLVRITGMEPTELPIDQQYQIGLLMRPPESG